MLLEGMNFDEFEREEGGNTPSPKKKSAVEKRRREDEKEEKEEEEKKEKEENKIKIRRGGARWNRGGRHVENASVTTTMQFGTPLSFYNHL